MLCFLKGTVRVRTRLLVAFGRPVTGQPKYAPYAFGVSRLLLNAYMLFRVLHSSLSCLGQGPRVLNGAHIKFAYAKRARARKRPHVTGAS
jgi:hypothetical protein